jgi:hypothetical protein
LISFGVHIESSDLVILVIGTPLTVTLSLLRFTSSRVSLYTRIRVVLTRFEASRPGEFRRCRHSPSRVLLLALLDQDLPCFHYTSINGGDSWPAKRRQSAWQRSLTKITGPIGALHSMYFGAFGHMETIQNMSGSELTCDRWGLGAIQETIKWPAGNDDPELLL